MSPNTTRVIRGGMVGAQDSRAPNQLIPGGNLIRPLSHKSDRVTVAGAPTFKMCRREGYSRYSGGSRNDSITSGDGSDLQYSRIALNDEEQRRYTCAFRLVKIISSGTPVGCVAGILLTSLPGFRSETRIHAAVHSPRKLLGIFRSSRYTPTRCPEPVCSLTAPGASFLRDTDSANRYLGTRVGVE